MDTHDQPCQEFEFELPHGSGSNPKIEAATSSVVSTLIGEQSPHTQQESYSSPQAEPEIEKTVVSMSENTQGGDRPTDDAVHPDQDGLDQAPHIPDTLDIEGTTSTSELPANLIISRKAESDTDPSTTSTDIRQECAFFLKNGTCAYGDRCKFSHPVERAPKVEFNSYALPLRPSEPECSYFLRHLSCGYGHTCKYHHPEPTPSQVQQIKQQQQAQNPPPLPPSQMISPHGPMMLGLGYPGMQGMPFVPASSPQGPNAMGLGAMAYMGMSMYPGYHPSAGGMQSMMHGGSGDGRGNLAAATYSGGRRSNNSNNHNSNNTAYNNSGRRSNNSVSSGGGSYYHHGRGDSSGTSGGYAPPPLESLGPHQQQQQQQQQRYSNSRGGGQRGQSSGSGQIGGSTKSNDNSQQQPLMVFGGQLPTLTSEELRKGMDGFCSISSPKEKPSSPLTHTKE